MRTITITSRDPEFITPEIKYLLRLRYAAMRHSRNEVAAALTSRIGSLIAKQNTRLLGQISRAAGTKQLWSAVNKLTGKRSSAEADLPATVEELNDFFAAASTGSTYQLPILKSTASPNSEFFNEANTFFILDRLRPTAEGLDNVPAWFLRLLAPVCARWIARLFNLSLNSSTIPEQWRDPVPAPWRRPNRRMVPEISSLSMWSPSYRRSWNVWWWTASYTKLWSNHPWTC